MTNLGNRDSDYFFKKEIKLKIVAVPISYSLK